MVVIAAVAYTEIRQGQINHNNNNTKADEKKGQSIFQRNRVALIPFIIMLGVGIATLLMVIIIIPAAPKSTRVCFLPKA